MTAGRRRDFANASGARVSPPATSAFSADDERFMRRALELAERGWGQTSPNPMVGAVVVNNGEIVGEGWHERYGADHAEVAALRVAGGASRGATVYVTLEPCRHHGKTPPCTDALIAARVQRVVYAVADPHPVAAGGAEALRSAGIDSQGGLLDIEARELNAAFLHAVVSDRPWVTLKLAVTLDAAIADGTETTSWITNDQSKHFVHHLRAGHDAVAVGMQTVRVDDPQLTVREAPPPRVPPTRVVFSRSGRLPLTSTLARTATEVPVIVVGEQLDPEYAHALADTGVEVLDAASLAEALRGLRARGIRSLLVEGGAGIAGAFLADGLVDRLMLLQAPVIFGRGALNAFAGVPPVRGRDAQRLRLLRRVSLGDDLLSVFALER